MLCIICIPLFLLPFFNLQVHSKCLALGTSRGYVLVFDHAQTLLHKLMLEVAGSGYTGVSAMDISCDGEHVIAGHTDGRLVLWDLQSKVALRTLDDCHVSPVSAVRFVNRDRFKVVSADVKGFVQLTTIPQGAASFSVEHQVCVFHF